METSFSGKAAAEQARCSGLELFQNQHYELALREFRRATSIYLVPEAAGGPFRLRTAGGVSEFASCLAFSGKCLRRIGRFQDACDCLEACFMTEPFERPADFAVFARDARTELAACYEELRDRRVIATPRPEDIRPDITRNFPFSLPEDARALVRLHELAPERSPDLREFAAAMRDRDAAARNAAHESDSRFWKRSDIAIWSVLGILWVLYGWIALRAFTSR
jgi:hypothetical protein